MTSIKEVIQQLESFAPLGLQENYDNSGLICGNSENKVSGALLSLDCTEEVIDEAIGKKCNLIISHHPVLFKPISKLTGENYVERSLIKAIKNDISLYAIHTNLDNVKTGVNGKICEKIGLANNRILKPAEGILRKLVTYCPLAYSDKVREALFAAGAGNIGNYDHCSFNTEGTGTFRGNDQSNAFAGKKNKDHREKEMRIECIYRFHDEGRIISALLEVHPYEEVAYDIYKLANKDKSIGAGMLGDLPEAIFLPDFLKILKKTFKTSSIRFTKDIGKPIKKVAVCGGSGAFLIRDAIMSGADVFVTSDLKYHQFFDAENQIMLADIGHFESEILATEIIAEILKENFSTFATYFSSVNTNPINYF